MVQRSNDVDAEYTEAFHTKSFLNIWAAAHKPKPTEPITSPSTFTFLLEPTQSTLIAAAGNIPAVLDYIDATLESSSACAVILAAIDHTRTIHRRYLAGGATADLSAYIDLGNSLSSQNLSQFHRSHARYPALLTRLVAERRRRWRRWRRVTWIDKVEAAGRGAYIVGREMDTVSRMVRRVYDEVEHRRDVLRMVLRSGEEETVKEVVREMEMGEDLFQEQIRELEDHVFLCLLTINRSRRLLYAGG